MRHTADGKLRADDERVARLLRWTPWFASLGVSVPLPFVFLGLYLAAASTESAAIYLLLAFVSVGAGLLVGALVLILLLFYRKRWYAQLRDRLAADGITANEVRWYTSELSSQERKAWSELKQKDPSLADAYGETLAARLTATRIIARARTGALKIERQLSRMRNIPNVDTSTLLNDLRLDRERLEVLQHEAGVRLSESKAQLLMIEAAANRTLDQRETDLMLRRLATSQQQIPLALEMATLEQEALIEFERAAETVRRGSPADSSIRKIE
ncbi:MAG: hypothetical protein ABR501_08870 [Pyrinomonadaceae bacterium]